MKKRELNEAVQCLGLERRVLRYDRDAYVFMLLERLALGLSVGEARRRGYAALIDKPAVKDHLRATGCQKLDRDFFTLAASARAHVFVATLAPWDGRDVGWGQVSRPGFNLVVQLNFNSADVRRYRELVQPKFNGAFNYDGHPVLTDGSRETLAWSRVDFDLSTGEALIEEIQTDWCRRARYVLNTAERYFRSATARPRWFVTDASRAALRHYVDTVLRPFSDVWAEAMLATTVQFIHDELGIRSIYYHTQECGGRIKRIRGTAKPPRSLYSALPRRFAFRKTDRTPRFLSRDKAFKRLHKKIRPLCWYHLSFDTAATRH